VRVRRLARVCGCCTASSAASRYVSERLVIVDDFLSPDTLQELRFRPLRCALLRVLLCLMGFPHHTVCIIALCCRRFIAHAPIFRTMRAGFLGAFPADGAATPHRHALTSARNHALTQTPTVHWYSPRSVSCAREGTCIWGCASLCDRGRHSMVPGFACRGYTHDYP
jgi:hypothetical protein